MHSTSRLKYLQSIIRTGNNTELLSRISPFCILVRCADHLGKIDDNRLPRFAPDENVELVEVTMYQSCTGKSNDEVHERRIQLSWGRYFRNLPSEFIVRKTKKLAHRRSTYKGYASMNSINIVCRAWSIGVGTGKLCSCSTLWLRSGYDLISGSDDYHLHECPFFLGSQPRHIHPGR